MNETTSEPLQDSPPAAGYQPPAAGRPPLRRAYYDRYLGGVAGGIAQYLGVDPVIVRIAFIVITAMGGAGVPAYLACLFLMPEEGSDVSLASSLIDSVRLFPGGTTPSGSDRSASPGDTPGPPYPPMRGR